MTETVLPVAAVPIVDARAGVRLAGWLAAAWVLLLIVGFVVLRQPEALAAGHPVGGDRAAFVAANVGSMAGFAMDFAAPGDFSLAVRTVFVLQTLAGLLMTLVGGGALWSRLLGRPYSDSQLAGTAMAMLAVAAAVGLLTHHVGDTFFGSLLRGVCALGNGGVLLGDPPRPGPMFSLALAPLSVLGSFGVVVVRDLATAIFDRKKLADHARAVLTLTAGLYLVGVGLLLFTTYTPDAHAAPALGRADALVWTARAWGQPVEFASGWSEGTLAVVIGIAVIGVGTAGTAGAIGLGWLVTVPKRLQSLALNGLTAQAVIAAAALAGLAWFEPTLTPARRVLLVVSSVMNLGLSHDPLNVTGLSLFVLAAAIVAAKLMPLVLMAVALRRPAEDVA